MTDRERIAVEVPPANASRDRVEARVFARLDAIRAAERGDVLAAGRSRSRVRWALAASGAAAAAIALGIVLRGELARSPGATAPSLVVTPVGGSSRFTVDDAVIDAGSDTEVEVRAGERGGVAFVLDRGTIDCDVAPRRGRPLEVRAGGVVIEVVGTRFSVTRTVGVRVDVTHGRVRVRTASGEVMVGPGERWSDRDPAAAAPARAPSEPTPPPATPPGQAPDVATADGGPDETVGPPPRPAVRSSRAAYQAAQRLEARDRSAAARAYRAVASGDDAWAALALYSLAELEESSGRPRDALAAVEEYLRRFPHGAGIEDVLWIRVENLRALGRHDDARDAAASYLRRFPAGTYVRPAARVAAPP